MKRLLLVAVFLLLSALVPVARAGDSVEGWASWYTAPGGVAMHFCTWTLRHASGCGVIEVTSLDTGISVIVEVVDYCQCLTGTARERLVDLSLPVLRTLGLDPRRGLYRVRLSRVDEPPVMPNTSFAR